MSDHTLSLAVPQFHRRPPQPWPGIRTRRVRGPGGRERKGYVV
jgi:hypothetical protein